MKTAHIIVPVADIYRDHTFTSEVITQGLLHEEVTILDGHDNWSRIEQWDGYQGWINNFYICFDEQYQEFIKLQEYRGDLRFYKVSHEAYEYVPYGASHYHSPAYSNSENDIRIQIIEDLDQLIGSPYKWGGKSSFGFDCSGLVQTVFKTQGILMPRDSKDQYNLIKNNKIELMQAKPGDLLFFKEDIKICHVGIYDNDFNFVHCSGYVKHDTLDEEDELFDKKLMDKFVGIFSISGIIKEQLNERK